MKLTSLVLILGFMSLGYIQDCEDCLDSGEEIEPQCGTDGVTYLNECQREECAESVYLAYEGICRCNCEARPIQETCGADGMIYRNPCALQCAGVPRGFNCNNFRRGSINCETCRNLFQPVCGIDGYNYDSECAASCYGVLPAYRGYCRT